ncbi:uncharacterized protein A1O5_04342 [Cladophialophora psammophila CBS 110553]|uniref:Major facilitator superfamily (MFS) profile domain-containing protein n=1 Tax=Cladophialophora psammophila CBS 110553 TaxID=1182543 RepID=W9X4L5_9EURO|nr:uncharacterized protein A1O5_04342 [Cladophialophora psammophila CBS 110553]EXJ71841.1 hypothetical protein A1O5_04342 [Cladophialophora psammophila CBS 110553]
MAIKFKIDKPRPKPLPTADEAYVVWVAGVASFVFGYYGNALSSSFAQPTFIAKFLGGKNAAGLTDAMLGTTQGGGAIGAVISAPLSNRYGRRMTTIAAAVATVISSALAAGSVNVAMFLVARVLGAISTGILMTNTPVYMSEVAPPHARGFLASAHPISVIIGLIVSSLAGLGLSFLDKPYQWRLQYVFLTFWAFVLCGAVLFIPESPRWLIKQGRRDEAWGILQKLHRSKHDPDAKLAHAEFVQIKAQIELEEPLPKGYAYIFRTPHLRKRAYCSIIIFVQTVATGNVVIAYFLAVIFSTLGMGTTLQLGLSTVYLTVAMLGGWVNSFIMDKVGRVRLLTAGGYATCCLLSIEAALQRYYVNSGNTAGLRACLVFIFIFIAVYGCLIDCIGYVYSSEIWPTHLRSHGTTIALTSYFLNALALSTPASSAFDSIGYKFYLIFVAINFVSTTFIMLYFPETAGLTLEEISAKFGDKVAVDLNTAYLQDVSTTNVEFNDKTSVPSEHREDMSELHIASQRRMKWRDHS